MLTDYFALAEHVAADCGATMNAGAIVAGLRSLRAVEVVSDESPEHSVAVSAMFIVNFRPFPDDESLRPAANSHRHSRRWELAAGRDAEVPEHVLDALRGVAFGVDAHDRLGA